MAAVMHLNPLGRFGIVVIQQRKDFLLSVLALSLFVSLTAHSDPDRRDASREAAQRWGREETQKVEQSQREHQMKSIQLFDEARRLEQQQQYQEAESKRMMGQIEQTKSEMLKQQADQNHKSADENDRNADKLTQYDDKVNSQANGKDPNTITVDRERRTQKESNEEPGKPTNVGGVPKEEIANLSNYTEERKALDEYIQNNQMNKSGLPSKTTVWVAETEGLGKANTFSIGFDPNARSGESRGGNTGSGYSSNSTIEPLAALPAGSSQNGNTVSGTLGGTAESGTPSTATQFGLPGSDGSSGPILLLKVKEPNKKGEKDSFFAEKKEEEPEVKDSRRNKKKKARGANDKKGSSRHVASNSKSKKR